MKNEINTESGELFERVVSILEKARSNVVRTVNVEMVTAYWLIGREIVESIQNGRGQSDYAKQLMDNLSKLLNDQYGKGFSTTNLRYFRQFYLVYSDRRVGAGTHPAEFATHCVANSAGFMPSLGWSHYRILMRVENEDARAYYEREASVNNWSVRQLERQVHSLFFERLLKSSDKDKMIEAVKNEPLELKPIDIIKDPYVLEFLDLPESHQLSEDALENALIDSLQKFLLELGQGFAFVARQKRISLDGDHYYTDLIFYHIPLKCYVVVDLKTEKLTHGDVGQMQLYVNYYDMEICGDGDNPTVGLLLCTEKNDSMVRYILGEHNEQIFASKYKLILPTMEELETELKKERFLLEESIAQYEVFNHG